MNTYSIILKFILLDNVFLMGFSQNIQFELLEWPNANRVSLFDFDILKKKIPYFLE